MKSKTSSFYLPATKSHARPSIVSPLIKKTPRCLLLCPGSSKPRTTSFITTNKAPKLRPFNGTPNVGTRLLPAARYQHGSGLMRCPGSGQKHRLCLLLFPVLKTTPSSGHPHLHPHNLSKLPATQSHLAHAEISCPSFPIEQCLLTRDYCFTPDFPAPAQLTHFPHFPPFPHISTSPLFSVRPRA